MNTLKPLSAKPDLHHQPLISSLHHYRPTFSRPISFLSFRTPPPPLPPSSPIRPLSSNPEPLVFKTLNHRPHLFKTLNPNAHPLDTPVYSSLIKSTLVSAVTAAALFFARFPFAVKPAIASPVAFPPSVEIDDDELVPAEEGDPEDEVVPEEEDEKDLEERLISNPEDVEALISLMDIRIKNKKMHEAIKIIDKLINLQPSEIQWRLLKSHFHVYNGDFKLAKEGFNEMLSEDPLLVEAYHGLIMAVSEKSDYVSSGELREVEKRIEEAMKICKKGNKKGDFRDFKLLLAQIRVLDGKYEDALKVYQELVKEEPTDFRPYLCQGIIYTMLRKETEAEKNFEKYRRLVPTGHPFERFFDDNMSLTKILAQKGKMEGFSLKDKN